MSGHSVAFGQTLQFITSIKLQELEKQRLSYQAHAKVLEESNAVGDNLVAKVEILAKAVESWSGSGSVTTSDNLGGKLNLANVHLWLTQAKHDPNFNPDTLRSWIETLETHIRHSLMRFDCAKLFGSLFNEWIASGDSSTAVATSNKEDSESVGASEFVNVGRQEMHDQLDRLNSTIFDERVVDTDSLKTYLSGLFSGEEAAKALDSLRNSLGIFEGGLKRMTLTARHVENAIRGLLASGLMDESKRATLAEFLENEIVVSEVASVLNMRLASLESWSWPTEGIVVEMRRHLNGKYRAFTDPELIDALMLQHIGVTWQVELKQDFLRIFESKAWKKPYPDSSPEMSERNAAQLHQTSPDSIQGRRRIECAEHFFLTQLSSSASQVSTYDDLLDAPETANEDSPAVIKQKLLRIMATECQLNSVIHGTHTVIRSDLEWFGPSLPHASILTVLKFFGVSDEWCSFFERFLHSPLRFKQDPTSQPRVRQCGTPISYALSVVFGEVLLFVMDFAVNQRAGGIYLYRMHDDLWLWNSDTTKCVAAWKEMNTYADLVGLKFNKEKTGSAWVGEGTEPTGLPAGDIRWGFLRFDQTEARFVIDQKDVDLHIVELRRQLASTKSVFGWVNSYNKYMTFFMRNFGGHPAQCFGHVHVTDAIDTLARIQRELFPDQAGAVAYLRSVIETRFGIRDLPQGYFYLPISSGGLELRHPMIELFAVKQPEIKNPVVQDFSILAAEDQTKYNALKESWNRGPSYNRKKGPFMSFNEYTALRETCLGDWASCYNRMLQTTDLEYVTLTPAVEASLTKESKWETLDWYKQWVVSLYGEEVVKRFGSLEVVDATLIPVGMVQLFRTSRMKLDE